MYKCYDCGCIFDKPSMYTEDLTPGGASEGGNFIYKYSGCPQCTGNFGEIEECCVCRETDYVENGTYDEYGFVCQHCEEDNN